VAGLIAIASAVAWLFFWRFAHSPTLHYLHQAHLIGPPMNGSYLLGGFLFVAGWTVMTIAMMLPTSIPLVRIFNRIAHDRPDRGLVTALVIVGYLSAWIGFGALAYVFAIGVHRASLEFPSITERVLIAGTLLFAGAFQFSSVKYSCLSKCRSPFGFVVEHWTGEYHLRQAWWLGMHHGLFCVGCCWALMLLMVFAGAGNLAVMCALGSVMAIEKNLRWGRHLVKPVGALLLALGLLVASHTDSLGPSRVLPVNRCAAPLSRGQRRSAQRVMRQWP